MSFAAPPKKSQAGERGIVLVAALLFVLLTSVLVLVLMTTTTGERTQSSNTQTARLALYATDAGVRTEQQLLANFAKAKLDSCYAAWVAAGSLPSQPIISNPATLFPAGTLGASYGGLTTAASSTNPAFTASGSISFSTATVGPASQTFDYMFTAQSTGSLSTTGKRSVQSTGVLRLSANRGSFSDFLVLTHQFTMANSGTVWFTSSDVLDGRVHTNDGFKFAFRPAFQDRVTQGGATATFYNNGGTPVVVDANNNGSIDMPAFYGGYFRGQPTIALPANANDQQCVALGLTPSGGVAPTSSQINQALTGSPTGSPVNKGYVVNNGTAVTGGLYVPGTAARVKVSADTADRIQYWQISVGANHVSIEIDPANNRTRVWNKMGMGGSPDYQYTGVPNGVLFASGGIDNLTGPDRDLSGSVDPALTLNQKWLVASNGDVVINGDLTCQSFDLGTNVLGIWSAGGAVRIGSSAPDNVDVDAFVMACGATNGEFRVDGHNSGSPRGAMTLRGGIVARFYGAFYTWDVNGNPVTGYTRNFHFDRRGIIPPWYPTSNTPLVPNVPSARTLAWKEI